MANRLLPIIRSARLTRLSSWRKVVPTILVPCRPLSVHEHYSLELMNKYGVTVPKGSVALSPREAKEIAIKLGGPSVIKAQVLAGGRGKGYFDNGLQGGVQLADSAEEIESFASQMLGNNLITKQTGSKGRKCDKVLIVEKMKILSEYYFALVMDRAFKGPCIVASPRGGMNIEEVAKETPSEIFKEGVDIFTGMSQDQAVNMAKRLGFSDECTDQAASQMVKLYAMMLEKDATMVEINPMVEAQDTSGQKKVVCMDAKVSFDDNAEYRQKDIFALRDWSQEDPRDVDAAHAGINYIGLTGSIGCLVNGAGLAMATMDIIKLHGGSPANFLDIGGGASSREVMDGFHIFNNDPNVNAIFVNIFGGIIRCDEIAKGIVAAAKESNLRIPIVVRLQGNNQKKANALIDASGLRMIGVDDFDKAAKTVVNVSKIVELAEEVSVGVDFTVF